MSTYDKYQVVCKACNKKKHWAQQKCAPSTWWHSFKRYIINFQHFLFHLPASSGLFPWFLAPVIFGGNYAHTYITLVFTKSQSDLCNQDRKRCLFFISLLPKLISFQVSDQVRFLLAYVKQFILTLSTEEELENFYLKLHDTLQFDGSAHLYLCQPCCLTHFPSP